METILVSTDFSETAKHATQYGWSLAKALSSKLLLANALPQPVPVATIGGMDLPYEAIEAHQNRVLEGLKIERDKLLHEESAPEQRELDFPEIKVATDIGPAYAYITKLVTKEKVDLVIAGLSGAGSASRFFLGSTSRDLINAAQFPVLFLRKDLDYKPIKQITFASELLVGDFSALAYVAEIARTLNASIKIAHIVTNKTLSESEKIEHFMLKAKAMFPGMDITYLNVYNHNELDGFEWLQEHLQTDWLVMIHREHHFLSNLFHQPFSQQMARTVKVPLLIIPENYKNQN